MKNILDFDENNKFVDHLLIEAHQLDDIIGLLSKNHVRHRVREVKHMEDSQGREHLNPVKLGAANYAIQVPINSKLKVDDLVKQNIETLNNDSKEVRRLFLTKSMDEEGLIDILLFPEEWQEGDVGLAVEILATKGLVIPTSEYNQRRAERKIIRSHEQALANWKSNVISFMVVVVLFWVCFALWFFSAN